MVDPVTYIHTCIYIHPARHPGRQGLRIRCPATVALRVAARQHGACFEAWYHIQNELTKQETQTDSESLKAQSVHSKFGKLSRSLFMQRSRCWRSLVWERGLVENLGEAVGHLVARAYKVRFDSAVELALA
eukprot:6185779-Pleurochrysis_carterae.AAC.1